MAVDSDGDQVRCRYGTTRGTECNGCNQPAGFQLDEGSCTLHYGYTAHNGVYGFELVVEDFPTHSITLSYTDGSQTTRLPLTKKRAKRQYVTSTTSPYWWLRTTTAYTATTPLSKLPLQFSLLVDSAAPSCQEGQYLPKFLSPTPRNEERLHAEATKEIVIRVKAQASYATIDDIIISGPLNVTKHKNTHGEFAIKWTPATRDLGDHFPICFIVEAANGSALYQSEMRCVLVEVEKPGVKADVICTETTMTVQVDKSTFPRLSENHLRLNDPSNTVCSLQQHSNQTHVIAVIPLNACGTQIEEDDINLMFKNEITTVDSPGSLITRKHLLEVEFYCQYPKHGNVSLGFSAHRRNVTVTEKGFGTFTYRFEFYEDNHFGRIVDPSTYPLEFEVGDSIYMGIEATSSVNNTELFVESCSAAPYDIPNYRPTYPIFVNGCTADPTVQIFAPGHKKEFHFGMEAFKFIGQHEQVYISCSVIICEAGNPNTRCSKGCLKSTSAGPHRRKRAAVIETGAHFISQGPLRLRKTPESRVTGLNLNMVFIVGSLLAAFGMVCGVLIYKAKRSTVKYQPLSSTEH